MPNIYDRIIKENIESLIPALTARTAGIIIHKMQDIKDKVQVTLEGEADFLKRVLHDDVADDFILQLEFQISVVLSIF